MRVNYADTALVVMPIHHVGGLNDTSVPFLTVGATTVLVDGGTSENAPDELAPSAVTLSRRIRDDYNRVRAFVVGTFHP